MSNSNHDTRFSIPPPPMVSGYSSRSMMNLRAIAAVDGIDRVPLAVPLQCVVEFLQC